MAEWTYDNPKKRTAVWEYLYLIIKDDTGDFPDGKVLLSEHDPKDEKECHDKILERNKLYKGWVIKDPQERQALEAKGFRKLELTDILDVGRIRYERDGTRFIDMRTRWSDFAQDYKYRRKAIKLVYAMIKKRQKAKLDLATSKLESKKLPEETAFIAFAPVGQSVQDPEIFLLEKGQKMMDFITEKQLEPWRVLTVGSLKADMNNKGQFVVGESVSLAPYDHTKQANEQLAVQKLQSQNLQRQKRIPTVFAVKKQLAGR